jgi:hypothetical protein
MIRITSLALARRVASGIVWTESLLIECLSPFAAPHPPGARARRTLLASQPLGKHDPQAARQGRAA